MLTVQLLCCLTVSEELQTDRLSPIQVLEAFQWRAIQVNEKLNCAVRFLPDARKMAELIEAKYRFQTRKPPLYGIPFSIKESIVALSCSTLGYAQNLGKINQKDAAMVTTIREAGGIPFVLTNVPQSLLSFSCSNPIFGTTLNPYDPSRTCGGSSGGEAALISSNGSVIGIGGDVGGSIRIPAHFCGIVGFKPTGDLFSHVGSYASVPGRPLICACLGPMARDVDSVVLFMRIVLSLGMHNLDPYVIPFTFQEEVYTSEKILTIGYYTDGFLPPISVCGRVVMMTKEMLEKKGHRLVKFNPPDIMHLAALSCGSCILDGGQYIYDKLRNDILDANTVYTYWMYFLPLWLRRLLGKILPSSMWRVRFLLNLFVEQWKNAGLDCLICPVNSCAALPHSYPQKLLPAALFTIHYNLLNFPAGAVPCTNITESDEAELKQRYVVNDIFSSKVFNAFSKESIGLPVGVQCVALPFMDVVCLRLMSIIEECWTALKNTGCS
ncbi:unnamed protein product [Soboliphyme baturini]|uniref:fatty acid amide hydrolase n=1 Tax=Soboliphyme baturini TaxID=241478 RepID=A0A183ILK3_9BILA|nr:unnamed protein product [Soboliphyme baturini]